MDSISTNADAILKNISRALNELDPHNLEPVPDCILSADRIFVVGRGRSDLVAKSFIHRLRDLGIKGFVVGESITPGTSSSDCLIAISGSGETTLTLNAARLAKRAGAKVIAITSYPDSPIGELADLVVRIRGRRRQSPKDPDYLARQITGAHEPFDPTGIVFEVSAMVLMEAIALELNERRRIESRPLT